MLFKEKNLKLCSENPPCEKMSTQIESDLYFESEPFQQQLPHHYRSILSDFRKISKAFALFNGAFFFLGVLEIGIFIALFPWSFESAPFAITLSILLLTLFSYLILLFHYVAKKPEQFQELIQTFTSACLSSLQPFSTSHHLAIAQALRKLSLYLTDYEKELFQISDRFPFINKIVSRCSANVTWKDVFRFKEALLRAAIGQHLMQLRVSPTDLELHASLANTYIALSQMYKAPKIEDAIWPHFYFYKKHQTQFLEKFKTYGSLAIEEFQILNDYAPNDPWIHEQLAAGYKALSMPQEEIREIELLLKLRPSDREVLFLLGNLYFQQGLNAKGLQIYEELKKIGFKKADHLLSTYTRSAERC